MSLKLFPAPYLSIYSIISIVESASNFIAINFFSYSSFLFCFSSLLSFSFYYLCLSKYALSRYSRSFWSLFILACLYFSIRALSSAFYYSYLILSYLSVSSFYWINLSSSCYCFNYRSCSSRILFASASASYYFLIRSFSSLICFYLISSCLLRSASSRSYFSFAIFSCLSLSFSFSRFSLSSLSYYSLASRSSLA